MASIANTKHEIHDGETGSLGVESVERVIGIVRSSSKDIGVVPKIGQFGADVVEVGSSKTLCDPIRNVQTLIAAIEDDFEQGALEQGALAEKVPPRGRTGHGRVEDEKRNREAPPARRGVRAPERSPADD